MDTDQRRIEKSSFMELEKPIALSQRGFLKIQAGLRTLAVLVTWAAITVIVTGSQSVFVFGLKFHARYNYSSAFRFLVGANAVACVFSVLSLIFVCILSRSSSCQIRHLFFLFLHDMVMTIVIISGCAAATAIGYVGQFGEGKMEWQALCNRVGKFCRQQMIGIVLSYLVFFTYLLLTTISAQKFMAKAPQ